MQFDDQWYSGTYPDVEGARLAGDVKSLREHFISSGYLEGRLPIELPFDPQWYLGLLRRHSQGLSVGGPRRDARALPDQGLL